MPTTRPPPVRMLAALDAVFVGDCIIVLEVFEPEVVEVLEAVEIALVTVTREVDVVGMTASLKNVLVVTTVFEVLMGALTTTLEKVETMVVTSVGRTALVVRTGVPAEETEVDVDVIVRSGGATKVPVGTRALEMVGEMAMGVARLVLVDTAS